MKQKTLGIITGFLGIIIYILTLSTGSSGWGSNLWFAIIGAWCIGYYSVESQSRRNPR